MSASCASHARASRHWRSGCVLDYARRVKYSRQVALGFTVVMWYLWVKINSSKQHNKQSNKQVAFRGPVVASNPQRRRRGRCVSGLWRRDSRLPLDITHVESHDAVRCSDFDFNVSTLNRFPGARFQRLVHRRPNTLRAPRAQKPPERVLGGSRLGRFLFLFLPATAAWPSQWGRRPFLRWPRRRRRPRSPSRNRSFRPTWLNVSSGQLQSPDSSKASARSSRKPDAPPSGRAPHRVP